MKKIYFVLSMLLIVMLPMSVQADDCLFTDSVLPGQPELRTVQHLSATIPVGTYAVSNAPFVMDLVSSDPSVVMVYDPSEAGTLIKLFAMKPGTATVSYSQLGLNSDGQCSTDHSVTYTVVKGNPQGGFEVGNTGVITEYEHDLGDRVMSISANFYTPTAYIENYEMFVRRAKVPASEISYTTSDASVAYMDEATNRLVIAGGGTAVLTASWPGNDEWNPAYATLTVNVNADPIYLTVMGTRVTHENKADILGDGKVEYDSETQTLTLHSVNWELPGYSSDIKYGVIEFWGEGDFYIQVDGKCRMTNTIMGINTYQHNQKTNKAHDITISIDGISEDASLQMTGYTVQIACENQIYVGFDGGVDICISSECRWGHALQASSLFVIQDSRMVISAYGERGVAAKIHYLTLGPTEYMPDCSFVSYQTNPSHCGFFTPDGQEASVVSILPYSVRTVIGNGQPANISTRTVITFNNPTGGSGEGEGGEGGETETSSDIASISLGENDQYNEETEQLEISSTLTAEEVSTALETFGIGSEALKYVMPGSIHFKLNPGSGKIELECMTIDGNQIMVKIGDEDPVSIIKSAMGIAEIEYEADEETPVIIFVNGQVGIDVHWAPAYYRAPREDETPQMAAAIKSIAVVPEENASTAIETVEQKEVPCNKVFRNGQLLILRGDKTYTLTGAEIR